MEHFPCVVVKSLLPNADCRYQRKRRLTRHPPPLNSSSYFCCFAHESFSVTVRLKIGAPFAESLSLQK